MKRIALAVFVALCLAGSVLQDPFQLDAQTIVAPQQPNQNFSFTAAGTGTPWMAVNGQSTCGVTFTSVGTGAVVLVQGASDSPSSGTISAQTVTSIGTNGSINPPVIGTAYNGNVASQALTYIRIFLTALSSGTVSGSIVCSNAVASSSGGGSGGSVTQGTIPWIVTGQGTAGTPDTAVLTVQGITSGFPIPVSGSVTGAVSITSPLPLPVSLPTASTLPVSIATTVPVSIAATVPVSGTLTVNTPAPAATPVVGAPIAVLVGQATATTAPGGGNASCVDVAGNQCVRVNVLATPAPIPSPYATAIATTGPVVVTAGAGVLFSGFFTATANVMCQIYGTATPTVGTTVPLIANIAVPGSATAFASTPFYIPTGQGIAFSALSVLCLTGLTPSGATPATSGTTSVQIFKS